jgi:hypothetical protein
MILLKHIPSAGLEKILVSSTSQWQTFFNASSIGRMTEQRTMATLFIIDLAGSERAAATSNMGQRMVEGANINKSGLRVCEYACDCRSQL